MYAETLKDLIRYIEYLNIEENEQLFILTASKDYQNIGPMTEFLNQKNIKFFGGIYPNLIVGTQEKKEGFIINKIEPIYTSIVLPNLMKQPFIDSSKEYTAITLLDGLSPKSKEITDTIYKKVGNKVKYIGGGAGFYTLVHKPCIYNNTGIFQDVAIVVIIEKEVVLSVKHGWKRLVGTFKVTSAAGNILKELNSKNAFDVYRHELQNIEGITLDEENFFRVAKEHPFGIPREGREDVVRDPIALNEKGEIINVVDISEGSDVYILKGDEASILAASDKVGCVCARNAHGTYKPLVFDCITRAMILAENFSKELSNIQGRLKYDLEGVVAIGEIASLQDGYLEIHNKSVVLGLIEEE